MSLRRDGFCVVPDILDRPLLARLRARTAALLARLPVRASPEINGRPAAWSISPPIPAFAELIAWPKALAALAAAGSAAPASAPATSSASRPRARPCSGTRTVGAGINPSSYGGAIHQVFLMYYLADTSIANGCLRVVPGSHRRRHSLHALLPGAHADRLARAADPGDPAFAAVGDERAVPVPGR